MKDECGKDPKHICYICKKGFHQKANFVRHNLTVHGKLYIQQSHEPSHKIKSRHHLEEIQIS